MLGSRLGGNYQIEGYSGFGIEGLGLRVEGLESLSVAQL